MSRSLLFGFVDSFQSKECSEKFQISSPNMKEFLWWFVQADGASLQQGVSVLKTATEDRRSQKLATFFAATHDPSLGRAGTEQVRQCLWESMAVQTYAAGDEHVVQWFLSLLREKGRSSVFLNGSMLSQGVLTRKKAALKTSLAQ